MKLFVIVCLCLFSSPVWAEVTLSKSQELLQNSLQSLAGTGGFSCQFKQIIFYNDQSQQDYSGQLAVARGNRFRWQYNLPYEQLYVSNGHGIWLYEKDLMQAQWFPSLDAVDPVVMRLLSGSVKAEEVHVLKVLPKSYHVRIGEGAAATELWIAIDEQAMPKWFESRDSLGHRNRMQLLSIQMKQPDLQLFEFEVPEGVDVIDINGRIMEKK
ncbi:MAG: outer-membrane lipoprotein carrier protein LolA [Mariprofundaceae bacterium]